MKTRSRQLTYPALTLALCLAPLLQAQTPSRPPPQPPVQPPPAARPPATTQPIAMATSQPTTQPANGFIVSEMIFATNGLNGEPITVPFDYPGKLVVVHFWATWCPSCAREVPYWTEASQAFKDRGVVFVGVPTDKSRGTPPAPVKEKAAQRGMNWPQVYDDAPKLSQDFHIDSLPGVFIVDGDNGRVLAQGNPIRKKNLAKVLNWLLEQRAKSAAQSPTVSAGDGKAASTNEPHATKNRVELRPIRKD